MTATNPAERLSSLKPIKALPPVVARKIAAGEVIDRPSAVVRELIDNSIDSGATRITVEITGGGIDRIRVTDDGSGMTADDLRICTLSHTTSKIAEENDLLSLSTLGFRGEALSSILAVSRLEITTVRPGHAAWKFIDGTVQPSRLATGTIVQVEDLFGNFPARRQFLKRPSSESSQCKQVFLEKALAWPEIEFRYNVDGETKLILPAPASLKERAITAMSPKEGEHFFHEIRGSGPGFTFTAVLGTPDVIRADKRDIMVFVNGRRIIEYSLVQAIEYGCEGHFPNGAHPFCLLFVTIDPSLIDFNIHPAKREARFRDPGVLHHGVSSVLRDFNKRYTIAAVYRENPLPPTLPYSETHTHFTPSASGTTYQYAAQATEPQQEYQQSEDFLYLGQVLGTFLVAEKDGCLYLVDQHAAHERILYDEFRSRTAERQQLMIPYTIRTESPAQDKALEKNAELLEQAGYSLSRVSPDSWEVSAVPARWKGTQDDLQAELTEPSADTEAFISRLFISAACRAACKDGDALDRETAKRLVAGAFSLPEPVCPHGRPVWIRLSRSELFSLVKRT